MEKKIMIESLDNSKKHFEVYLQLGCNLDINDMVLTKDNKYIITAHKENFIILWDAKSLLELKRLKLSTGSIGITQDNKYLIYDNGYIKISDLITKKEVDFFTFREPVIPTDLIIFTSDAKKAIFVNFNNGSIYILDLNTKKELGYSYINREGWKLGPYFVKLDPDNKYIFFTIDMLTRIYDINNGELIEKKGNSGIFKYLAFTKYSILDLSYTSLSDRETFDFKDYIYSADRKYIAIQGSVKCKLINFETGKLLHTFKGNYSGFSPNCKYLFIQEHCVGTMISTITIYDIENTNQIVQIEAKYPEGNSFEKEWVTTNNIIYFINKNHNPEYYDFINKKSISSLPTPYRKKVSYQSKSSDNKYIVSCYNENERGGYFEADKNFIFLWDIENYKVLKSDYGHSAYLSNNGEFIAYLNGFQDNVQIYSIKEAKTIQIIKGYAARSYSISFLSREAKYIAIHSSRHEGYTLNLLEVKSHKIVFSRDTESLCKVFITNDNKYFIYNDFNTVNIFNITDNKYKELKSYSVATFHNKQQLIFVENNIIKLIDFSTNEETDLCSCEFEVSSMTISKNEEYLFFGLDDGTVNVLNILTKEKFELLKNNFIAKQIVINPENTLLKCTSGVPTSVKEHIINLTTYEIIQTFENVGYPFYIVLLNNYKYIVFEYETIKKFDMKKEIVEFINIFQKEWIVSIDNKYYNYSGKSKKYIGLKKNNTR